MRSTRLAMVDLPAPDNPVNHRIRGDCPLSVAWASRFTSTACQCTFCARRKAKCSMPAPTVRLLRRSIMMNPPVSRLSA
ncbi:hypothetical protein D3C75_1180740 [compost metagenome]